MESVIIGIDLGGTNLRIGAVTSDNEMIAPFVLKSSIVADAEKPVEKICEIIADYSEKNRIRKIEAISIGVPSSVENDKETVICTTNIRNRAGEPRALRRVVPHPDVDLQQFVRLRHDHAEELAFADGRIAEPAPRAAVQAFPYELQRADPRQHRVPREMPPVDRVRRIEPHAESVMPLLGQVVVYAGEQVLHRVWSQG